LLGSDTNGLAFSASDDSMVIRDTVTPANAYVGTTTAKLGSVRASAGLYYDSSFVIQSSANALRRDYDARVTGPKYLIEPAATNYRTYSSDFSNAVWSVNEITRTAGATTAPDGTTTATLLVPSTLNNPHRLIDSGVLAAVAGTWTVSQFVKPSGYTQVGFRENLASGASVSFFLTGSGTVDVVRNAGAVTASGRITALANGWYRVEATFVGTTTPSVAFYVFGGGYTSGDPFGYSWTGNGTSGVYVWLSTVEDGVFATSPIPTTSAAVTRAADKPLIATTAFNWQTATVTLYAKYSRRTNVGDVHLYSQAGVRAFELYSAAGTPSVYQNTLGALAALSAPAALTTPKVAAAGAVNDFAMSSNGAAVVTDATTSAMIAVTTLNVGSLDGNANWLSGWIIDGMHLPRRMTNAEITTVTTP
jgi:hypothetical protein